MPTKNDYAKQTDFPLPSGGKAKVPVQADASDERSLAKTLAKYLPAAEASAVSQVVVDPVAVRAMVEEEDFTSIETPSGRVLKGIKTEVWSPAISADGANGRARLQQQRDLDIEDPWPLPEAVDSEPVMVYEARSIERMAEAVTASADAIVTTDMTTRVRAHERGIWNPPVIVLGRVKTEDATVSILHACEGSTRISTAHKITGTGHGAPLKRAGALRAFIAEERQRITSGLVRTPSSKAAQDAAKLLTVRMVVVLEVVDEAGARSTAPFFETVAQYVESVHEEPRAWDELEQGNNIGERLILELRRAGQIDDSDVADFLQRSDFHAVDALPSALSGRIIRSITKKSADHVLRRVILADPAAKNLTIGRVATAVAPLTIRAHRKVSGKRDSAIPALSRGFMPKWLSQGDWSVTDRSTSDLLAVCEEQVKEDPDALSDDIRELVARCCGALCCLGLVLSDQGQAVDNKPELRGSVMEVVDGLRKTVGGLRVLAESAQRVDGERPNMPVHRDVDGLAQTVQDADGVDVEDLLDPADRRTNQRVRALALNRGVIPPDGGTPGPGGGPKPQPKDPRELFKATQDDFVQASGVLLKLKDRLLEIQDTAGERLIKTEKLSPVKVKPVPDRLSEALQFIWQNIGDDVPSGEPVIEFEGDEAGDDEIDDSGEELVPIPED